MHMNKDNNKREINHELKRGSKSFGLNTFTYYKISFKNLVFKN